MQVIHARFAPVVVVCALWSVGCVTPQPVHVTDRIDLPESLVSAACEEGQMENAIVTMEGAELLFDDDVPRGLRCYLFQFGIDAHLRRWVDFRRSTHAVNRIRAYLVANGIPVPPMFRGT